MASRYPSNRYYDDEDRSVDRVQPGISRSRSQSYSGRSSGYSSGRGGQRSSARYDDRPMRRTGSSRSASSQPRRSSSGGQRPPQRRPSGNRRPQPKRRSNVGFYVAIGVLALILVAVILIVARPGGVIDQPTNHPTTVAATPTPTPATAVPAVIDNTDGTSTDATSQNAGLTAELGDTGNQVEGLAADQMVQVSDLSIKEGLPEEWLNVLLLGTDGRTLDESERTDAMMICSINRNTGEVKLTSIMRDLAIEYTDIGKYNGTYRINAANYFGGPKLAMRTINEKFNMNIQYYVMVNFFGFQKIAQRVGGIEIDITEAEKDKINKMIVKQAKFARREGIDESDQENVFLETYGENTHLNGRQTLAYARIRKLTGGDAMRTERQRLVLEKLLEKVKNLDAIQLAALASDMISQVKTNLPFDDMFAIAMQVCGNGIKSIDDLRLPLSGTYVEEYRNDQSMLYDCDFQANALELYNFIYDN